MKLTNEGIALIKKFESLRLNSYQDTGGVWTIGYGDTTLADGSRVGPNQTISAATAEALLQRELEVVAGSVRQIVRPDLNDNQFSALVSFTYNLGLGAFKQSTLFQKAQSNPNDSTIRDEFLKYKYDNSVFLQGLLNRRIEEADLYFKKKVMPDLHLPLARVLSSSYW